MTVPTNLNRVSYAGNGITTAFGTSPVVFFAASDLQVYVVINATGAFTLKTLTTHYTVSGGAGAVGIVTMITPPATGETLLILRIMPLVQGADYINGDNSDANVAEQVADKIVMIAQQLEEKIGRQLTIPVSEVGTPELTNLPFDRALRFLAFGPNKEVVASVGTLGAPPVSAFMETLLDDPDAASAAATLQLSTPSDAISNLGFFSSVAGGALIIHLKTRTGVDPSATNKATIAFRNTSAAFGGYTLIDITSATSITIANGATLGTNDNTPFRFWIVAINDDGILRLGAINCVSQALDIGFGRKVSAIYPLRDDALVTSTIMNSSSNAAQVIYTPDVSVVTPRPMRILGYVEYVAGVFSVGTYALTPSKVQLFGPGVASPGDVIQEARIVDGQVATGTTLIPDDDSIPQISEGNLYFSQSIVPRSEANVLSIETQAIFAASVSPSTTGLALFRGGVVNAITASRAYNPAANVSGSMNVNHLMLSTTVASISFSVRLGLDTAGTLTVNGTAGARKYGNVLNSYLSVKEIMG